MPQPVVLDSGLATRLGGTPCLVMLDVDGTLAPIVTRHDEATVPPATRRAVAELVRQPGVHVALVSGRGVTMAHRMVGVDGVWAVGNHGSETRHPDGRVEIDPGVASFEPAVAKVAATLGPLVAMVPGAVLENKTWTLTVHYRQADPGAVPRLRGAIEELARRHDLRLTAGKMIFEIRPPVDVDKGTAVRALAERMGALAPGASLLFAGDDATDEDGFRVLREHAPHAVTVRVVEQDVGETAAEFTTAGTGGMLQMLEWLAELRK